MLMFFFQILFYCPNNNYKQIKKSLVIYQLKKEIYIFNILIYCLNKCHFQIDIFLLNLSSLLSGVTVL